MGWSGIENGELLRLAAEHDFQAFVSTDRGLEHEQNVPALPLAVLVLLGNDNKLSTIERAVPALLEALRELRPRTLTKVTVPE